MAYFKFLDSEHLSNALSGSVIFSRLSFFRLLEMQSRKAWIGDRNDGRSVTKFDKISITRDNPNIKARQAMERAGILRLGSNTNLIMENCHTIEHIECYTFSCSWGPLSRLRRVLGQLGQEQTYSAAVRISHIQDLVDVIWENGKYTPLGTGGSVPEKAISETFSSIDWSFVTYGRNLFDAVEDGYRTASPYLKNAFFRAQSEVRIILSPCPLSLPDKILVKFPNVKGLLTKAYDDGPQATSLAAEPTFTPFFVYEELFRVNSKVGQINDDAGAEELTYQVIQLYWQARKFGVRDQFADQFLTSSEFWPNVISWRPQIYMIIRDLRAGLMNYIQTLK